VIVVVGVLVGVCVLVTNGPGVIDTVGVYRKVSVGVSVTVGVSVFVGVLVVVADGVRDPVGVVVGVDVGPPK